MASWGAVAHAEPAPVRPRARPQPRKRPVARERRVTGGIVSIVVLGILLAGVVAMNVAVLQLNIGLDKLGRERVDLRAENAALSSQLSSAASPPRIQGLAARRLGLVTATAEGTTYVELGRPAR